MRIDPNLGVFWQIENCMFLEVKEENRDWAISKPLTLIKTVGSRLEWWTGAEVGLG